jgi:quinol-cytochrome oxidoreductase complex cytochrome b subunit
MRWPEGPHARSSVESLVRHARIERMVRRVGWAAAAVFVLLLIAAIASIFYKYVPPFYSSPQ